MVEEVINTELNIGIKKIICREDEDKKTCN
jgi:hypothetical protein